MATLEELLARLAGRPQRTGQIPESMRELFRPRADTVVLPTPDSDSLAAGKTFEHLYTGPALIQGLTWRLEADVQLTIILDGRTILSTTGPEEGSLSYPPGVEPAPRYNHTFRLKNTSMNATRKGRFIAKVVRGV